MLCLSAKDKPPEFQKALEELMAKIRKGETLTPGSVRGQTGRSVSISHTMSLLSYLIMVDFYLLMLLKYFFNQLIRCCLICKRSE